MALRAVKYHMWRWFPIFRFLDWKKNIFQWNWCLQCCCVIAQFFQDALSESRLDEMETEILRNKLYKVTAGWHKTRITTMFYQVCGILISGLTAVPNMFNKPRWCKSLCFNHCYTNRLSDLMFFSLASKAYLESFHSFCKKNGGATKDLMCPILEVHPLLYCNSSVTAGRI